LTGASAALAAGAADKVSKAMANAAAKEAVFLRARFMDFS